MELRCWHAKKYATFQIWLGLFPLLKILYNQTLNELRMVGSCFELQSGLEALGRLVLTPTVFRSTFSGIPLVITNIYFCAQDKDDRNDMFS